MGQSRRQFTDEFKREAVALLASSGRPLTQIAGELGVAPSMLRNWRDRSGGRNAGPALRPNTPASAPHSVPDPAAEISRLRRENDRLRMERDILKKLWPSSWSPRNEVPPDRGSAGRLAGARHVRCADCVAVRLLRLAVTAREPAQDRRSWGSWAISSAFMLAIGNDMARRASMPSCGPRATPSAVNGSSG